MDALIIGKAFSIDLTALYEHIGHNDETMYGHYIDHDFSSDYYDLRTDGHIYACDGETCKVVDVGAHCVTIDNVEEKSIPFLLSIEEFEICSHSTLH